MVAPEARAASVIRSSLVGAATVAEQLAHRLEPMRRSGRFTASLLDRFAAWIECAPEEDLFRVAPLQFGARERIPNRDAVDLFVHAAHAGIFDFSWGVLCLDCAAFITTRGGLRALGRKALCKL